jgi:hypothetical protein
MGKHQNRWDQMMGSILYPEFLALLTKYLCLTVLQESCKMAKVLIDKYNIS